MKIPEATFWVATTLAIVLVVVIGLLWLFRGRPSAERDRESVACSVVGCAI